MQREDAIGAIGQALREIAPETDLGSVDPAADLAEELDLDSMDVLELHAALAEQTGVAIPDTMRASLTTVDQLVAHLLGPGTGPR